LDRTIPDEVLMQNYAKGEMAAFDELLARHRQPLFGYLCRMLGNRELAEDVFQEVFIRVINARERYEKSAKFTTWLYKIAHNLCIDTFRRENFRKTESLFEPASNANGEDVSLQEVIPGANPGPDEIIARQQLSEILKRCVSRLSPEQREVFVLRQYQELSFREIAHATETTESTVKSRMRYALNNLRTMLVEERIVEGVTF